MLEKLLEFLPLAFEILFCHVNFLTAFLHVINTRINEVLKGVYFIISFLIISI